MVTTKPPQPSALQPEGVVMADDSNLGLGSPENSSGDRKLEAKLWIPFFKRVRVDVWTLTL